VRLKTRRRMSREGSESAYEALGLIVAIVAVTLSGLVFCTALCVFILRMYEKYVERNAVRVMEVVDAPVRMGGGQPPRIRVEPPGDVYVPKDTGAGVGSLVVPMETGAGVGSPVVPMETGMGTASVRGVGSLTNSRGSVRSSTSLQRPVF